MTSKQHSVHFVDPIEDIPPTTPEEAAAALRVLAHHSALDLAHMIGLRP